MREVAQSCSGKPNSAPHSLIRTAIDSNDWGTPRTSRRALKRARVVTILHVATMRTVPHGEIRQTLSRQAVLCAVSSDQDVSTRSDFRPDSRLGGDPVGPPRRAPPVESPATIEETCPSLPTSLPASSTQTTATCPTSSSSASIAPQFGRTNALPRPTPTHLAGKKPPIEALSRSI